MADVWNPVQYERFATERRQPFDDLLAMVHAIPAGRAVDLGCGTGELTVELHRHLGAASTVGIDSSRAMLEKAPVETSVRFELDDLTTFTAEGPLDVIFSNAALHWTPDHEQLLRRLSTMLAPRGQLAVQVPYNHDHASHEVSAALAREEPFASAMHGEPPADPVALNVLAPARYAELLHALGFTAQRVRLEVYGHLLASTADVAEWTKGTSLTRIRRVLADDLYDTFVARYTERLVAALGDHHPYFFAFKRILFWARMP